MSVSITIDGLDADILDRLQVEAMRRGVDVNAVILQVIQDGLTPASTPGSEQLHHDLDALAGTWSAEEADAFRAATEDVRKVDEDLWK